MIEKENPALAALIEELRPELVMGQVRLLRLPQGFELRHEADRQTASSSLRRVQVTALRSLAQVTAGGTFRPLKSAPTLQRGWIAVATGSAELSLALTQLYPGAVADWFAARTEPVPATHYREFTGRQTGMYRITQKLDDAQASGVVRAVCDRSFCLKRRLWTVGSDPVDLAAEKSIIPCLEPCAVLMEFARKAFRWEQEEKTAWSVSPCEMASLKDLLGAALSSPPASGVREADFDEPTNPRRLRWIYQRMA